MGRLKFITHIILKLLSKTHAHLFPFINMNPAHWVLKEKHLLITIYITIIKKNNNLHNIVYTIMKTYNVFPEFILDVLQNFIYDLIYRVTSLYMYIDIIYINDRYLRISVPLSNDFIKIRFMKFCWYLD